MLSLSARRPTSNKSSAELSLTRAMVLFASILLFVIGFFNIGDLRA